MSKSLILDCSVTLSWCFSDETTETSDRALDYVRRNEALVPQLWGLEVTNGLLQASRKKRISSDGIFGFLELFARLPIRAVPVSVADCFSGVLALAERHGLSAYDACYLHLAVREKSPLATLDKPLQAAAKELGLLWKP